MSGFQPVFGLAGADFRGRGSPLLLIGLCAAFLVLGGFQARKSVLVYKSPDCDCCDRWVGYLRASGFAVTVHDTRDMGAVKAKGGVPRPLASCHTAVASNYVIEGHVPTSAIGRLLNGEPSIAGIAVPGMPQGSPGMEGPRPVTYNVLAFDRIGVTTFYEQIN